MNEMIQRFDNAVLDLWEPHPSPTEESISRIEKNFGIILPKEFIDLARYSKSYSSYFVSLGPDFDFHGHIIEKNNMVRHHDDWLSLGVGLQLPSNLRIISENFMSDFFWCFDISKPGPDYPIVYWAPYYCLIAPYGRYKNFSAFVDGIINKAA